MLTYKEIVDSYLANPRDVITKPIINRAGKWFHVSSRDGKIMIETALFETPKCSISKTRILAEKELPIIYELYCKRKKGVAISKEAIDSTRNQVYWYGIFNDLNM